MPDFLSRLIDRTHGRTPVLRPRHSSVFEPVENRSHPTTMPFAGAVPRSSEKSKFVLETPAAQESPAYLPIAKGQVDAGTQSFLDTRRETENVNAATSVNPHPNEANSKSSLRQAVEKWVPSAPKDELEPSLVDVRVPAKPSTATNGAVDLQQSTGVPTAVAHSPQIVHAGIQVEPSNPVADAEEKAIGRSVSPVEAARTKLADSFHPTSINHPCSPEVDVQEQQAWESQRVTPIRAGILQPVRSTLSHIPVETSRRNILNGRDAAPVEPTVHVTIGRVEVRATPTTTPAQPTRPGLPKLGLAEYLSQNGGRR